MKEIGYYGSGRVFVEPEDNEEEIQANEEALLATRNVQFDECSDSDNDDYDPDDEDEGSIKED